MKEIAAAFVKAQTMFSPALKTSTNPHFKSKYVSLDGCIEAVIDALNNNGIALIQKTGRDDSGVTVRTVLLHESGQEIDGGELHVPASKQDPQGYGSALTYARRYSLMAACGIAPEDDDDGNAASRKPQPPPPPLKISDDQCNAMDDILRETKTEKDKFFSEISKRAGFEISTTSQIPVEAYDQIMRTLNKKRELNGISK
jgi:hypothetical protein